MTANARRAPADRRRHQLDAIGQHDDVRRPLRERRRAAQAGRHVGLRQRGRVVDAVAHHRDARALRLQRGDRARACPRAAARRARRGCRACAPPRRRSPGGRPTAARASRRARAAARPAPRAPGRSVSANANSACQPRASPSPTSVSVRVAREGGEPLGHLLPPGRPRIGTARRAPPRRRRAPSRPRRSTCRASSTAGRSPSGAACRNARASGCSERASSAAASAVARAGSAPSTVAHPVRRRPPDGQRAGLVEHDVRDLGQRFERVRPRQHDAAARERTGRGRQRGGRGQRERARARHGEDGERDGERARGIGDRPEDRGRERQHQHDRDEDGGDAVRAAHCRGARVRRALGKPQDRGEARVLACRRRRA